MKLSRKLRRAGFPQWADEARILELKAHEHDRYLDAVNEADAITTLDGWDDTGPTCRMQDNRER